MRQTDYGRRELLYDPVAIESVLEQYENAYAIKEGINTPAMTTEIRTAVRFWRGDPMPTHSDRYSDRVLQRLRAVERGQYELVGNELKYAADVST